MQSKMYSTHAQQYATAIQDNIYNAHFERPSLQKMIGTVQGMTILDLGCGPGIYAEYLLQQGAKHVTCIDASEAMLECVRERCGNRVKAYVHDLSLGLPQEEACSFDLVISPLVLHYLEDLNPLFKDIHRILKPKASCIFSTHHPFADFKDSLSGNYFQQEQLNTTWNTISTPLDVTYYRRSLTDLTSAITRNGLAITQLSEVQHLKRSKNAPKNTTHIYQHNPISSLSNVKNSIFKRGSTETDVHSQTWKNYFSICPANRLYIQSSRTSYFKR